MIEKVYMICPICKNRVHIIYYYSDGVLLLSCDHLYDPSTNK